VKKRLTRKEEFLKDKCQVTSDVVYPVLGRSEEHSCLRQHADVSRGARRQRKDVYSGFPYMDVSTERASTCRKIEAYPRPNLSSSCIHGTGLYLRSSLITEITAAGVLQHSKGIHIFSAVRKFHTFSYKFQVAILVRQLPD